MSVLVPHGTTPTGWGIFQLEGPEEGDWNPDEDEGPWVRLAALTPCCGSRVVDNWRSSADLTCFGCGKDFSDDPVAEDWNLAYIADFSENMGDYEKGISIRWLRGMTGSDELEVSIEWQA